MTKEKAKTFEEEIREQNKRINELYDKLGKYHVDWENGKRKK